MGSLCEMETISQLKIGYHWGTTPKETSKVLISALSCWARVGFILKTAASWYSIGRDLLTTSIFYCIVQCKKHWVINSCATFVCIRHMLHMTNYDGEYPVNDIQAWRMLIMRCEHMHWWTIKTACTGRLLDVGSHWELSSPWVSLVLQAIYVLSEL